MNAKELQDILDRDPNYQSMMADKARHRAELEAMFTSEEEPLIAALTAAGWPPAVQQCGNSRSVWDLVNTSVPYPHLLETLADHSTHPYHFRVREGIARALAVRDARGTRVPRILMDELRKLVDPQSEPENSYRTALINTLCVIADSSLLEDVQELAEDSRFEATNLEMQRLVKKLSKSGRSNPKSQKRIE